MSKTVADWIDELRSRDKGVRSEAVRALSYMGETAVEPLLQSLHDDTVDVEVLGRVLGEIGQPALDRLTDMLQAETEPIKVKVARLLALIADNRSVIPLVMALEDAAVPVRVAVAEALGSFSDPRAAGPLMDALGDESADVRANAATSLGSYYRDPRVVHALLKAAGDDQPLVRSGAARAMAYLQDERAVARLHAMAEDPDSDVRLIAAAALQHQKGDRMVFERMKVDVSDKVEALVNRILEDDELDEADMDDLRNSNPRVRARLLEMVGDKGSANAVKLLLPGLTDINPAVRKTAVDSLVRLGPAVVDPLVEALSNNSKFIRAGALEALGIIADERMIEPASALIHDDAEIVRREVVRSLARFGNRDDVVRVLKLALKDRHPEVSDLAAQSLEEMGVSVSNPVSRLFRRLTGKS